MYACDAIKCWIYGGSRNIKMNICFYSHPSLVGEADNSKNTMKNALLGNGTMTTEKCSRDALGVFVGISKDLLQNRVGWV